MLTASPPFPARTKATDEEAAAPSAGSVAAYCCKGTLSGSGHVGDSFGSTLGCAIAQGRYLSDEARGSSNPYQRHPWHHDSMPCTVRAVLYAAAPNGLYCKLGLLLCGLLGEVVPTGLYFPDCMACSCADSRGYRWTGSRSSKGE